MSASSRTIHQSQGFGSFLAPLGIAAAALLATLSIAWGAMTLPSAGAPGATGAALQAPQVLDHGSRGEIAPAAGAPVFIDDGGRLDPVSTYPRLKAQ